MLNWLKGGDKVDHPMASAKAAKEIIDGFPYKNPWKALEDANHWLGSINDTAEFKVDRRYELIDMLDVATRKTQAQLSDSFLALRDDSQVQEKRIAKTLTDFWTLLGNSYLICAKQCKNGSVPGSMKAQLPVLAARGIRALRHQVKWVLMRYGVVRPDVWAECGLFAALAESVNSEAKPVELYEGSGAGSPNDEMLRLVMYWAASVSGLSPIEQHVAEGLIAHLTPQFRCSTRREDAFDFYLALDSAQPPLRLIDASPATPQTRYFDAGESRAAVKAMQETANRGGGLPAGLELGRAAEPYLVARVCRHLGLNWAKEMPARASERRKTAIALNVAHGYASVLGVVAPGNTEGLDFENALSHESWVADDVSAGGYGVIVPPGKGEWLRVGILVAVRTETSTAWHVAVIRRVKTDGYNQRHIGIQLISKSAVPVYLRRTSEIGQDCKGLCAMLLSERPSPNGSLHIVVRRDLFSGREPVEATYGKDEKILMLQPGGVVESGHDFDWLRYKVPGEDIITI